MSRIMDSSPEGRQKKLFTPGPLSCTMAVKQAMLHDYGSRDAEFIDIVKDVRQRLLDIAGASPVEWSIVPLQGSGTYCVEAAIHTAVPRDKDARVLVLSNGAYGRRLAKICAAADLSHDVLEFGEAQPYDLAKVERQLSSRAYACVAAVHCETSCGLLNPVDALASSLRARQPGAAFVVDAMSSFGALPVRLDRVHFLVASANKCVQGVPGFGFVLARTHRLAQCAGQVIYPGKITSVECFRIGCIGDLYPNDVKHLLKCIGQVLEDMGVPIPVP
ncbi:Uncharacterized protein GBIM_19376 [Gryllus bimaculatus]|nr:Uncharacterized protein GBIM_19376 [Gryllus bimaculatus]